MCLSQKTLTHVERWFQVFQALKPKLTISLLYNMVQMISAETIQQYGEGKDPVSTLRRTSTNAAKNLLKHV